MGAVQPRRHPTGHPVRPWGQLVLVRHHAVRHADRPGAGERRARAAALLTAALPGALYVYQGDELGLPEVEDLPLEALQDSMHFRAGRTDPGRDGCRVPLPWTRSGHSFGFSPDGSGTPAWLPQPAAGWGERSVEVQDHDPRSMLALHRAALASRRSEPALRGERFSWLDSTEDVLAFTRDDVVCVVDLGTAPMPLPDHHEVLLTSVDLDGDHLPADAAAWLRA